MKYLLKSADGRFVGDNDDWTSSQEKARDFKTSDDVLRYCQVRKGQDLTLVLAFSTPRYDIELRDVCPP
jgi:hypothetical protein